MIKDSFYMFVTTILKILTGSVLFFILARVWGVQVFGQFMYPYTVTSLITIIIDYGFVLQLVKDISKNPDKVGLLVARSLFAKLVLVIILIVLSIIVMTVFPQAEGFSGLFWLLLFSNIIASFALFICFPLRSLGYFKEEMTVTFYSYIFHFSLVFVLIFLRPNEIMVAIVFFISRLFYLCMSWIAYKRLIGRLQISGFNFKVIVVTLSRNLPYAVHVIMGTLYFQIDTLIVHHYLGNTGLGVYQAGFRILTVGLILIDVLTNVYLPRLSRDSNVHKKILELGKNMTRQMLLIGAIGSLIMIGMADSIVHSFFGNTYESTKNLLKLFAIVLVLRYFGASYGTILTIYNKQNVRAFATMVALLINVTVNLFLIPLYGVNGAVVSAIITVVILNGIYHYYVWKIFKSTLLDIKNSFLIAMLVVSLILSETFFRKDNNFDVLYIVLLIISVIVIGTTSNERNKVKGGARIVKKIIKKYG